MFVQLANLVFEVEGVDPRRIPMDYRAEGASSASRRIIITPELIAKERAQAEQPGHTDDYLASLALHRQIAEVGPQLGLFVAHMAVVEYQGHAYAFAASSGTGKSTHIRLWMDAFGAEVTVINGDKPILTLGNKRQVIAHGAPWAGKEGWQTNTGAPLAGICLLSRGARNECRGIAAPEALPRIMQQVYMPQNPVSAELTLDFLDVLLRGVPLFDLTCTMERSAAKVSFEAMTGLDFDTCARDREAEHED